MRSSIACIRCRRSKVKCVNDGIGTTCRACQNAGRECSYPSPMTVGMRQQREGVSGRAEGGAAGAAGSGEGRPRPRKRTHTSENNGVGVGESSRPPQQHLDALDSRLLTPAVWQELFDIFQTHYSADLPFLHPPTFLKPLQQANMQPPSAMGSAAEAVSSARPPMSVEFLLAFLALTARFHPKLVAHHSPPTSTQPSNPIIASDYYASAATARLSGIWAHENQIQDIERTQAMLMLGLHEWGMCRGARAWVTVGVAIRSAQVMGLQYERDLDDEPLSRSVALEPEAESMPYLRPRRSLSSPKGEGDAFIQQELRRRTFWSCYIMDRYLSSGKFRPQMLHAKELRIQLPASERAFLFAERVRTLMLCEEEDGVPGRAEVQSVRRASVFNIATISAPGPSEPPSPKTAAMNESEDDKGRLEVGENEGLVSRYIKILEIYGRIMKWSCAGGRRTEMYPPWEGRSEYSHLHKLCHEFKASLPRQDTLTPQNTQAHIIRKTSTPYMLVHTIYSLCLMMLHREYVPFIPIRCSKPEGPIDPPLFPADKYNVPPGFWEDSARECFRSAHNIIDLVRSCQEWTALVETPIVGFALYNVAFAGVYCFNFPWMDTEGWLCTRILANGTSKAQDSKPAESSGFEAARKALEMVGQMRSKLKMADGWFRTVNRMHKYFRRIKSDYRKNVAAMESSSSGSDASPISTRHLSLREGGAGGGLDEFKLLERTLHDFGNLEDQDVEMVDADQRPNSRPYDAVYDDARSHSGVTVKSEDAEPRPPASAARSENGPWNPINTVSGSGDSHNDSVSTSSNGAIRATDPPNPPSHPPQLRQASDTQQVSNFRQYPPISPNGPSPPSHRPSPLSRTASAPSHSPTWDRQYHPYPTWPPPPAPYPVPNIQPAYSERPAYQQPQLPTPIQYPNHNHGHSQQPQQMNAPGAMQEHAPRWNENETEAWFNALPTGIGGDDYAAFAEGGEIGEWATMHANRGFGGSEWLSTVWQ